jgi:hypothetical protein
MTRTWMNISKIARQKTISRGTAKEAEVQHQKAPNRSRDDRPSVRSRHSPRSMRWCCRDTRPIWEAKAPGMGTASSPALA